jgi:NAD(P)-dependent dehydrogenase (short-subunit alcohol dehydrogenase family)
MSVIDRFRMDGQAAVITGGGAGIGRGIAETFADAGAAAVVSDLAVDKAEAVPAGVHAPRRQGGCHGLQRDRGGGARRAGPVRRRHLRQDHGANVRQGDYTPLWDASVASAAKPYVLNTVSANLPANMFPLHQVKQENASATVSGSSVGTSPSPEFISYSNAKAALLHRAKSIAMVAGPNQRSNSIVVGSVNNGEAMLNAGYDPEMLERLSDSMVMKRRGALYDIPYGFNFLLSPAAAWVTGVQLDINGGGTYESKVPTGD